MTEEDPLSIKNFHSNILFFLRVIMIIIIIIVIVIGCEDCVGNYSENGTAWNNEDTSKRFVSLEKLEKEL